MGRREISLNDDRWHFGMVDGRPFASVNDVEEVKEWLPAIVPGDVRLDLMRAGKISDPFFGMQNESSQWIDQHDWWFARDISEPAADEHRLFLVFEGIDYLSAVFWDGVELGRHAGMFSRQVYELPSSSGRLAVRVWGAHAFPRLKKKPSDRLLRFASSRLNLGQVFPDRLATVKCQMGFGWDFAPRLLSCGIWDNAWLVATRRVYIRDLWVQAVPDGRVRLTVELDATEETHLSASIRIRPVDQDVDETGEEFELTIPQGRSEARFDLAVHSPRLWYSWDLGEPNLYRVEVKLRDDSGDLDSISDRFGFRTIEIVPNKGAIRDQPPWQFSVNGAREFIRGANWVPVDAIPARVQRADYQALLNLVRAANVNLLRVWGGGLKEKRAFYEMCDEYGIMVWQDFPFSATPLDRYPSTEEFATLARTESAEIVRALRNHPSLALWCGGNEFNPRTNKHLVGILRASAARFDGTRPFKPSSPSEGEVHNWDVWHHLANTRDYRKTSAQFVGEFGLQSPPDANRLADFLPEGALFPPGTAWTYHSAEMQKLRRYALAIKPAPRSLADFVDASQKAQLRGLQVMIEHARRRKPLISGCIFWQFNEPWPAICWSVVDYSRRPKPAYFKIKELYNPVLVSFEYDLIQRKAGDIVDGTVWLINDTLTTARGELKAWLNGKEIFSTMATANPDSVKRLIPLVVSIGEGANSLAFELNVEGKSISTNEYDLNYCDRGDISMPASWFSTIRSRMSG